MNKKEENNNQNLLESIKPKKIIYPILIGLSVVGYMLYHEFDINALNEIKFTNTSLLFITIAILCMIIRDPGLYVQAQSTNRQLPYLEEMFQDNNAVGIHLGQLHLRQ